MNSWTALGRARSAMDRFDTICEQDIALVMGRGRSRRPRVKSASGYVQNTTHRAHGILGLVRFHEREDFFGSSVLSRANQMRCLPSSETIRRIERHSGFQQSVAEHKQLPHHCGNDRHVRFAGSFHAIGECLKGWIVAYSSYCGKVKRSAEVCVSTFR